MASLNSDTECGNFSPKEVACEIRKAAKDWLRERKAEHDLIVEIATLVEKGRRDKAKAQLEALPEELQRIFPDAIWDYIFFT